MNMNTFQFIKTLNLQNLYTFAKFLRYILLMYTTSRFFLPKSSGTYFCMGASYLYKKYCKNCKKKEDYELLLKYVNQEIQKQEEKEKEKQKQKEKEKDDELVMVYVSS